MEKKNDYIAPTVSVVDLSSEGLMADIGGIPVASGVHHGGFGAKQQDIVVEDDYDDEEMEDESTQSTTAISYKPYKLWDDDL